MLIDNPKKDFNPTDKRYVNVADKSKLATQFSIQSDWQFRIYAQMLYRSQQCDYNIYFFTLTFKDKFLPVFRYQELTCPCFDHELINRFCRSCQMDLLRMFSCSDYDYIVCSEYGKTATFRAHHHCSFMVHSSVPALAVHRIIKKNWSVLTGEYKRNGAPCRESIGWVLPDKIKGWKDKKGYVHSDFQVDPKNIDSCAIYLSKYCTKQVGWFINPNVKEVLTRIELNHDKQAFENFNKVKPWLKTSLHFGECINDWIMGKNVPDAITVDADYKHNLFYGVYTPLRRKCLTQIPFYNIRKLMYSRVEEYVEEKFNYAENEYYSYDIFTNSFTRNPKCIGCCPLTASDVFKGLRPLKTKKTLQYKWDVEISDFWREYMPYEYEQKIKTVTDKINNVQCWLPTSAFHKWLKDKLNKEQYDTFCNILSSVSAHSLAVYVTAYQYRCSPLHLYAYLENSDLFKNGYSIEEYNFLYFDKFAKKSYFVLQEDLVSNFHNYVTTFVDSEVGLDASLAEVQRPFFSGHETIEEMVAYAKDFYLSKANYLTRSYYYTGKPDTNNVLFNAFPCFRFYDLVYSAIQDYLSECTEKKMKVIEDKFHKKQLLKSLVYAQS